MSYQGKHARPSRQSRWLTVPLIAAALVATASPASAVEPRPNEGLIAMTARVCGSSATWKQVAAANGVRGSAYTIFLGRDYKVSCARQPAKASRSTTRTSGWVHPLPGAPLTSCYGWRWGSLHTGLDMDGYKGQPVRAVAAGVVMAVGWIGTGYGREVFIYHGANTWSHYAHLNGFAVRVGQKVSAGQRIAYVGNSGFVVSGKGDGSHLHLNIMRYGKTSNVRSLYGHEVNPAPFLRARGVSVGC
jgi:murein DD-endopeptidase MepM/ murein hydrolase activator NlpD